MLCDVFAGIRWIMKLCSDHSLKNRTGPPVGPEKTGTGDLSGLLSALNRPRQRTGKNRLNRTVFSETGEPGGFQ